MDIRRIFNFAIILLVVIIYGCNTGKDQFDRCAGAGEQFSKVYFEEYPKSCCDRLTGWDSGMDTRIAIGDNCYETGAMAGNPIGTCINCGNGICEDIENPCNCIDDCAGGKNSRYSDVEEFCNSSQGIRILEECSYGMELPICLLC